jgi:hydrogenase/urease accessory protein HupE
MKCFFRFTIGFLLSFLAVHTAQAHLFAPSLLKVEETKQYHYNVVWKTPAKSSSNIPLRPIWPENCVVLSESSPQKEGTGIVTSWQLNCAQLGEQGLVGHVLGVTGLGANQVSAMMILSLRDGRNYQQVLTAQNSKFRVPVEPQQSQIMTEYSVLGTEHIWGGIDHLMFVFGLLLLVGGGSRLLWTITAFTLGHSITLSLVTLGFLRFPVPLVEFTIALSIFILALNLARNDFSRSDGGGLFRVYPWWLAGGFGLLHGMGFAGALAEIGLPQSNVPLALLFFNIGIEVGQIAFILLLLGAWWLVKRPLLRWQERLLPVPIYVLGGLSAMWCIERGVVVLS